MDTNKEIYIVGLNTKTDASTFVDDTVRLWKTEDTKVDDNNHDRGGMTHRTY
jgi:hypothetical protein